MTKKFQKLLIIIFRVQYSRIKNGTLIGSLSYLCLSQHIFTKSTGENKLKLGIYRVK